MRFSNEPTIENHPIPCPRCGREVVWEGSQANQTVIVQPIDWTRSSVRRGEMVVIADSDTQRLEVKRVVGFPNESLWIRDGDLWIDGHRFQKSIEQFASMAIEVERWSEIEGQHSSDVGKVPMEQSFQSFSLWRRVNENLEPSLSPILDEYRCNAMESRQLVPVRDIGLKLVISESEPTSATIEVRLWFDNAARYLRIELSPDRFRIQSPARTIASDGFIELHSPLEQSQPSRTLIVAVVDGRLLVGSERSGISLNVSDYLLDRNTASSDWPDERSISPECSATKPISLTLLEGRISIVQAFIVRDIHYRGWNGEDEISLPAVAGYRLLGDNVSNSADSRQRWPDGVPAESIVGRIDHW